MIKKILVIGSKGSVGKEIINTLKLYKFTNYLSLNRKKVDVVKNFKKLEKIIIKFKPTHIINCVAMTNILRCETESSAAYEINTIFPIKLANNIKKKNIKLIHISTEAVFRGNLKHKLYNEKDISEPTTVYGKSKLLADQYLGNFKNSLIIRLPLLFGPTHENQIVDRLIKKLLLNEKIFVSTDVYSTPVYTPDLSKFLFLNILKKNYSYSGKVIHFTSKKYLSMYQLIKIFAKIIKKEKLIKGVKDSFFEKDKSKTKFPAIKPKFLGLKTINKKFICTLDHYKFIKHYE
jgi:dTDP-4-dehydrorhamnose reductase